MHHPMQRALDRVADSVDPLYDWHEGPQSLWVKRIIFDGVRGAAIYYENPPVHQVSSEGLSAYQEAFKRIAAHQDLQFVLLLSSCDPLHVGGDLKETRSRLEDTRTQIEDLPLDDPARNSYYRWADERLEKAFALYQSVRSLAQDIPIVAVCGGGTRYGGSAEIALWADTLIGDSRSAMCFSEATIGLIPGWGGVGRLITKAGLMNAQSLAQTARETSAQVLGQIGVYDEIVDIEEPFPSRGRGQQKSQHHTLLGAHTYRTALQLLPVAFRHAIGQWEGKARRLDALIAPHILHDEVRRRSDPDAYSQMWGLPIGEIDHLVLLGKPLAPQSIAALKELFATYNEEAWDEESFVRLEMELDAALYRDERLHRGIVATLEGHIANFSGKEGPTP